VAAEISAQAGSVKQVVFCCFSDASARHHADAFGDLGLV
jgi:hypothetical protein